MEPEARLNYLRTTANFDTYQTGQIAKAKQTRLRRAKEMEWTAENRVGGTQFKFTGTLYGMTGTTRCARTRLP